MQKYELKMYAGAQRTQKFLNLAFLEADLLLITCKEKNQWIDKFCIIYLPSPTIELTGCNFKYSYLFLLQQ